MGKKSKFTDEQIVRAVREVEAGANQTDVARKLGVTQQTIYRWKERWGDGTASSPWSSSYES